MVGAARSFEILLGTAILCLILLLIAVVWSFFHGVLNLADAAAAIGFAAVMAGVLAWAFLHARDTVD
jgi:amino acid transporter